MKRILQALLLLIVAIIFYSNNVQAQTQGKLTLRVVEATASKTPVLGAMVELIPTDATKLKPHYTTTDYKGEASFGTVVFSEYTLRVSLIGYETKAIKYQINNSTLNIGDFTLDVEAKDIEQINFTAKSMRTSQKGDTLAYNADSYKVSRDADASTLLSKMPGITVSDGVVEAQGETVQKVLVDGRELFGDDVSSAIANIPAESIKNIEVFDKKSDQAEFTGVDDGEDYKAINITTKPNMRNGIFGKAYAAYVLDDMYSVGASLNMFHENRKISVVATSNNVNQQNFSIDDILGAVSNGGGTRGGNSSFITSSQAGVSKTNAIMVNYSEKYSEKITATAGYSFSSSINDLYKYTDRIYTFSADSVQSYIEDYSRESNNMNHRFNGKIDWNINARNTIMFRPDFSFQNYDMTGLTNGETSLSIADMSSVLNTLDKTASQDKFGYNINNVLVYRHKFNNAGRSINMFVKGNWSKTDNDVLSDSYTIYGTAGSSSDTDETNKNTLNLSTSRTISGNIAYIEPLSSSSFLVFRYNHSNKFSDTDQAAYLYDPITGGYNIFSDSLSNIYTSSYVTHEVGPSFRYNTKETNFVASVGYQIAELSGDQKSPEIEDPITTKSFQNFTYFSMLRHKFSNQTNMRFKIRSNINTPSISELQEVVDYTDPLFVSSGNSKLKPTYRHNVNANINHSNIFRGSTLMGSIWADIRQNYIGSKVTIAQDQSITMPNGYELCQGGQYTEPINLNGYMSFGGKINYGFPVSFIYSNLNLNFSTSYTEMPSIINDKENTTQTIAYGAGAVLGSNISEFVDFTLSYRGGYNVATNTIQTSSDNTYLSHKAEARLKVEAWWGITFTATGTYYQYKGVTDNYNEQYTLVNMALGKKVFNNRRGEISVGVNDLLDQNTSFTRNVTDTYIENVTSNVLGRLFNITFTYNLRSYIK